MADKIQRAIEKMQLCRDGISELQEMIEDVASPEVYGTIMGLHQLADEAIIILTSTALPSAKES